MSTVKSDLLLNDRMTAVIRDINQALTGCIDAMEQMERTGSTAFDADTLRDLRIAADQAEAELDDMGSAFDNAGEAAEESEGKFSKVGSVLKGVGAAAGAAAIAVGAAAFKLGKEVVSSYADYEQLVGGVETLFGAGGQSLAEYAKANGKTVAEISKQYDALKAVEDTVLSNADRAYKTAGLSANEYMETVTGFSASLIQSLGGDTAKAAKYADMAIIDMADNANKMGTDMASIQNAYQGFAKQNYTMLDNLKLGYGGTKEEMERLLEDAQKLSGQKYDISSYADIVDAIHVVQTEMGITGTTAKEAEGTISGSINMLKASFQNLLTGLGDPEADVKQLAENVVTSFDSVLGNIVPVLENIVSVLPTAARTLLNAIAKLLPNILQAVTSLFSSVLSMLVKLLPKLTPPVVNGVLQIVQSIIQCLPQLVNAATLLVIALANGLAQALPSLLPMAVQAVVTIVQGLLENLPLIVEAALQLVLAIVQGVIEAIPILISALPKIITGIVEFLLKSVPQIVQCGIQLLTSLVQALPTIISAIVAALPQIINGIVKTLLSNIPAIVQAGFDLLVALIQNLPAIISAIVAAIPQIIDGIVSAVVSMIPNLVSCGYNLMMGLKEGIKNAAAALWESVKEVVSGLINGAKDFLGISSPSKVFREIGGYTMEGLSLGLEKGGQYAVQTASEVISDVRNAAGELSATAQIGAEYAGATGSFTTQRGGDYDTMRTAAAVTPTGSAVIKNEFHFDMSGAQNQFNDGSSYEDYISFFTDSVRKALATAAQGVY